MPSLDGPAVRLCAELLRALLVDEGPSEHNPLHAVVDDWNLGDAALEAAREAAAAEGASGTEWAVLVALGALTVEERGSAMARAEGFVA